MSHSSASTGNDIALIKNQLEQIKALHLAGALSVQAYDEARSALERRVLDWALQEAPVAVPKAEAVEALPVSPAPVVVTAVDNPMSMQQMAILAAVVVAVFAIIGYLWMGRTPSVLPKLSINTVTAPVVVASAPSQAPHTNNLSDISVMTDKLAARLKTAPNDAAGWALLARSYVELGKYPDALGAYQKAMTLQGNDPVLLADYAEALAVVNKKGLTGASSLTSLSPQPALSSSAGLTVSGTVTLSPALAKNAKPDDTVFVVAKLQQGSSMPLALLRKQVSDLPLQFTLDDSMGMSSATKLSAASKVIVSARITKNANPAPEKGDLIGQSNVVSVGVKGLLIEINGITQ